MKSAYSYLRVIGYLILAFLLFELTIDAGDKMAIEAYPIIGLVLLVILFFAIAFEAIIGTVRNTMYRALSAEAKERHDLAKQEREAKRFKKLKAWYHKQLDSKPMEKEETIVLDHDYDGIKELDNNLPPWWINLFYLTIIFAVGYMLYYHVFDGPTQEMEYDREVAAAAIAVEEYKKNNPDLIDASSVEMLTEESDLKAGKSIYDTNCAVCHRADGGGGIGPNLTDEYWILGGDIASVYNVVAEGGRSGKGMIAWKGELNPLEMAQVSSYILTMQGTNPADAKEPEGDLYVPEE
ncbi:MAG TPA: cbb3-type cytochrome c oxidase N-terminal domain-containing protein [Flavobacteriaceae bacterium]|nr:cbb3-type cytochrome c oxidase N-terminal domain-containing protein [Flavobacteriaceae bacterium]